MICKDAAYELERQSYSVNHINSASFGSLNKVPWSRQCLCIIGSNPYGPAKNDFYQRTILYLRFFMIQSRRVNPLNVSNTFLLLLYLITDIIYGIAKNRCRFSSTFYLKLFILLYTNKIIMALITGTSNYIWCMKYIL
ncbi:hypothetical protein O6H91_10G103600 [Diphasiastrum complanatum]|uniref:Uncharacterized protein n=1 Tax=Diphasiastrum complanatum TaxID=34168 RepID=A0ACC2CKB4_DIPCM|nr:hypothetical protein O6H91_10G103600 [Diphasiastrum complanatum]